MFLWNRICNIALRTANDDSYPSAMCYAIVIGMPSASMSAGNHWLLSGTKGLRITVSFGHPEAIPAGKVMKVAHSYWEILNAIFYLLRSGCAWRMLPHEFPPWKTVCHYFCFWRLRACLKIKFGSIIEIELTHSKWKIVTLSHKISKVQSQTTMGNAFNFVHRVRKIT